MRRTKPSFRAMPPHEVGMVGRRPLMDPIPAPSTYALPPSATTRLGKRVRVAPNKHIPRFQYAPFRAMDIDRILSQSSTAEVRVPAAHLTPKSDGLKRRLLWGSGEYTDDSDVVAMLVHSGRIVIHAKGSAPFDALIVTLAFKRHKRDSSPPFLAHEGHGLRSRPWSAVYDGARVSVVRVIAVCDGQEKELPRPVLALVPNSIPRLRPWQQLAGDAARAGATVPPETACFNLSNHPCLAFALAIVADRGLDKPLWPSRRLWREVIYVETADKRYEIAKVDAPDREPSKDSEKDGGKDKEVVKEKRKGLYIRFGQVSPKAVKREFFTADVNAVAGPVDISDLEKGFGVHKWSALRWDPTGLTLGGRHYDLKRAFFRSIPKKRDVEKTEAK